MRTRALLATLSLAAASNALAQMPTLQLAAGMYLIHAEVANTFDSRATGLMFRRSMAANEGRYMSLEKGPSMASAARSAGSDQPPTRRRSRARGPASGAPEAGGAPPLTQ